MTGGRDGGHKPRVEHDGETLYFCREGCKAAFELRGASPASN